MKIFVTGGAGYIGSRVVEDLVANGHEVEALSRSEANDVKLLKLGASPLRGDLADSDSLRRGVEKADAIVHLAFGHFSQNMAENFEFGRIEAGAIEAIGRQIADGRKPFVTTSGCGLIEDGVLIYETTLRADDEGLFRKSEQATRAIVAEGANAMVVRIPQVHGQRNEGFVPLLIQLARGHGYAAYIGEGKNRWPAVHVDDAAAVYRLALEKGRAGKIYHAVAEEGVTLQAIASVIAEKLNVPLRTITSEQAEAYFGPFAMFAAMDNPVSSERTRDELGWKPSRHTMLDELWDGDYFQVH